MSDNTYNQKNIRIEQHPFMVFCNFIERELRKICPSISNFEVGFMLGSVWENLPEEEKDLYDPYRNMVTSNDIKRITNRLLPYLRFRISVINSSSNTINILEDDSSFGRTMIDLWVSLTSIQKESWKDRSDVKL